MSQQFSIEALDLASGFLLAENASSTEVDKWWHLRHYSHEGVAHSFDGFREARM